MSFFLQLNRFDLIQIQFTAIILFDKEKILSYERMAERKKDLESWKRWEMDWRGYEM